MTIPRVHAFIETGENRKPRIGEPYVGHPSGDIYVRSVDPSKAPDYPILRRLPDDWLAKAVERVLRLVEGQLLREGDTTRDAILEAILGPAREPEPEAWEIEAAKEWNQNPRADLTSDETFERSLARHFAAARRKAQEKP